VEEKEPNAMNRHSAKFRISLGLTCLLISILMLAAALGFIPDPSTAVLKGRGALCEAIAVNGSILVSRGDLPRFEQALDAIVRRNPEMISAAVEQVSGKVVARAGARDGVGAGDPGSTISIPLWSGDKKWGDVKVRFQPLRRAGILGFLDSPAYRMVAFVAALSFLTFALYIRKVLDHLDPAKVVPRRVRSALDTLAEGLILMDRKERIVLANRAFAERLGMPAEGLQGRRASSLPWIVAADSKKLPWLQAMEHGAPVTGAMLGLPDSRSGTSHLLVNSAPVVGEDGGQRGIIASFEDVTLLQEKEQELEKSKEAAEAASRAKGDFLARMSHEIRTPLNAVIGFTEVLRRGMEESEEARREYLETIHTSGRHLLDLINDILDLSKVESGRLEIERIRCSPVQAATETIAVLRGRADQKGIGLLFRAEGKIPETVLTDPGRLRQVLMNLAGNAIKFTERGGVEIRVRMAEARGKRLLAFDVVDTGIGIEPDALEKIFEPFSQANTSIARRFGGTGLGLAISKQFVEALGGTLTVESRTGKGSTFTATIDPGPLEGIPFVEPPPDGSIPRAKPAPRPSSMRLPPARILVVDDGESNRKLAALVLGRAGAEVESADDGLAGIERAERGHFDIILMDMQMPVMDGFQATKILRERGSRAPIIAMTAQAMKSDEEKCKAAGCSGFIPKPLDLDLLLKTVAAELARIRNLPAPPAPAAPTPKAAGPDPSKRERPEEAPAVPREVRSSLDLDDPEIHEIVAEFVERLRGKMDLMRGAWSKGDFDELARLAHWLKGSAGTAGFHDFTNAARDLEVLAKEHKVDRAEAAIDRLALMTERVVLPSPQTGGPGR
jgi:PAS domain S-box-containing protein